MKLHKYVLKIAVLFGLFIGILAPSLTTAQVDNWYIKDFKTRIELRTNNSLKITEDIVADCGNASGKHGIFRVLPTRMYLESDQYLDTPIYLTSITDFNGKEYKYKPIISGKDHTITWQIGDPNKTVTGVNNYRITYEVRNVIRQGNAEFDELYWNLNGAFWDLQINAFQAEVFLPSDIQQNQVRVNNYGGQFGANNNLNVGASWSSEQSIRYKSQTKLNPGDAITTSLTFPKNIIKSYNLTSGDKAILSGRNYRLVNSPWLKALNGFGLILPILLAWLLYAIWRKYGRDVKLPSTIAPEFEIPEKLAPVEMGTVLGNGTVVGRYFTAGIINLAVKGLMKITEIPTKNIFVPKDFVFQKTGDSLEGLPTSEKLLLERLFSGKDEVKLSSLRNKFYQDEQDIQKLVQSELKLQNLIDMTGLYISLGLIIGGLTVFGGLTFLVIGLIASGFNLGLLLYGLILSVIVCIIFGLIMTRQPEKGAKLARRIKGFKMYMLKAEKYRQQFNEKENIFERFLPYAIMFGITKQWINNIKNIYGEEYYRSYMPAWFIGSSLASFDASSMNSVITGLSNSMSTTLASNPSSSGSGGGGFSGGGGGGGGGGGW